MAPPPAQHPDRHRHRRHLHRRRRASTRSRASWSPPRRPRRRATRRTASWPASTRCSACWACRPAHGDAIAAVSHGTTVATNQLLEGKVDRLGFVTTEGYEAMLEIARQSVPDGYGNSYFWVKPDRIVPRDLVRGVGGRLDFTGAEVRPFDEGPPARRPAGSATGASPPSASASCTPTPTPSTRSGCARSSPRSTPTPWSRCPARCCASTASTSAP